MYICVIENENPTCAGDENSTLPEDFWAFRYEWCATDDHDRVLEAESVVECMRHCTNETDFDCQSLDFVVAEQPLCYLRAERRYEVATYQATTDCHSLDRGRSGKLFVDLSN